MRRKQLWCIGAGVVCLLLAGLFLLFRTQLVGQFGSQDVARRWQGESENSYAQITCFIDDTVGQQADALMGVRKSVDTALAPTGVTAWADGYSSVTTMTAKSDKGSVSARAIVTGGDYFLFHPLVMMSGATYDDTNINHDSVVLDMKLAWNLFGGYNLAGKEITVNGQRVVISGVARTPEHGPEAEAYGTKATIYVSYGLLKKMNQNPAVTCYEAVLPNPVSSAALTTLKEALSVQEERSEFLENTGRFGYLKSLKNAVDFGKQAMRTSSVTYPYWENAARAGESLCTLYTIFMTLFLLYPAGYVAYWIIRLLVLADRRFQSWRNKRKSYR